jgi:aminopeptidase-like protein
MKVNPLKICKDLYKIPRSLTGRGVVKSLKYLQKYVPLTIKKIPSGTNVFDWKVPPEWNIDSAYIIDCSTDKKIVDFQDNNLHVVGYSESVNRELDYSELCTHLHFLKDQPSAVPYVTSYYSKTWGFCITYNQFKSLNKKSKYKVVINSEKNDSGFLHYGELVIKGTVKEEVFFSSYICHPQMVNNELSGPSVITDIASSMLTRNNHYTYRFVWIPETIGSITYLSLNLDYLKSNVIGGFNVTCVGDERSWGHIPSRYGNNISDKVAEHILKHNVKKFIKYSWLDRGSDERQYCAPGIDLPISSITRSKYGEYPEYHTSLDNFELVTNKGLCQSVQIYMKCIEVFESNLIKPKFNVFCEPQLGKRGLYPNTSTKDSPKKVKNMMNFISYCDGENTILEISELCNIDFSESLSYFKILKKEKLLV